MRNPLSSILMDAWTPADRREPWRWCEDHIKSIPYSPLPGPFRSENSPWIREVMEAIVDPKIRLVSIIAAVQSSKTTSPALTLCYIIANLPGPCFGSTRRTKTQKTNRKAACKNFLKVASL